MGGKCYADDDTAPYCEFVEWNDHIVVHNYGMYVANSV